MGTVTIVITSEKVTSKEGNRDPLRSHTSTGCSQQNGRHYLLTTQQISYKN